MAFNFRDVIAEDQGFGLGDAEASPCCVADLGWIGQFEIGRIARGEQRVNIYRAGVYFFNIGHERVEGDDGGGVMEQGESDLVGFGKVRVREGNRTGR